ncbi:MAG: exodeoxyribonuclease VII large subunit [Acidobacteria bacterium]|nr:exodeoxyribonuclease VII large subunit [Acidobacteriota bacterium]
MSQFSFNLAPERKVLTVTELTGRIRDTLAIQFRDLWVGGEISNCKAAQSGHLYFTLKDEGAQIRCVCFRQQARLLKFQPEDGLRVTVRGSVSVYETRGEYQLYIEHIEPVGLGALQLAFEQLKKRLEAEGLFGAERKKQLPLLPRRIGIITSPTGAAIRDVLRILRRRHPGLHILIYPVRVQGDGAAEDVASALAYLNRVGAADVLIVTRGGGSLEDLWAFNEESVARAIAASEIPVISAVGHEIDFTISDFVADLRAPTPSAAAEMVVATRQQFHEQIGQFSQRLTQQMRVLILEWRQTVQELASHDGFRRLEDLLRERRQQADEFSTRLGEAFGVRVTAAQRRFAFAATRLASVDFREKFKSARLRLEQRSADLFLRMERALTARRQQLDRAILQLDERSPLRVLERGYAIVTNARGANVSDAVQVSSGEEISIQLHRGRLAAEVKKRMAQS